MQVRTQPKQQRRLQDRHNKSTLSSELTFFSFATAFGLNRPRTGLLASAARATDGDNMLFPVPGWRPLALLPFFFVFLDFRRLFDERPLTVLLLLDMVVGSSIPLS